MASPLKSGKKSVNMAAPVRVSKIRRDPPPIAKKIAERDPDERDARSVVIGVIAFGLAIFIITLGFSSYQGSPSNDEPIHLNLD